MDFSSWKPAHRLRIEYERALRRLMAQYFPAPSADYHELLDRLTGVIGNPEFVSKAETISRRMVAGAVRANEQSWREAARRSMQGRKIYQALRSELNGPVGLVVRTLLHRNAELISSLPYDVARRTNNYVAKRQLEGARADQIAKEIRKKLPQLTDSRIKLIARTEVGKAETAVTRARAQNIGLNYFQWATSEDSRVRKSHKLMNGVVCSWDELPSPEVLAGEKSEGRYGPGEIYNCRCVALPIVTPDEISFPAKVYRSGSLTRMSRSQFQRLSMPLAA